MNHTKDLDSFDPGANKTTVWWRGLARLHPVLRSLLQTMASNLLGLLRCWEHTALDPRRDSPDLALQNIHAIDSSTKAPGMLYNPNGTVPQGEINMDQHPLIMEKGNAGRVWDPNISRGQERKNKRMKRKSQCTMKYKEKGGKWQETSRNQEIKQLSRI